jgi:cytochrome c-type biogenesis protein CcmH
MILPALLALILLVVLFVVLRPLWRGVAAGGSGHDQAVYRDQLAELDRDVSRGVVLAEEAAVVRLEIQRRLLAADRMAAPVPRGHGAPIVAGCVALVVALGSAALYEGLSTPTRITDTAILARAEAEARMARLRETLAAEPTNREAWLLYASSAAATSDWDLAIEAYQRAVALDTTDADSLAALGEVLVARAMGVVVPDARARFQAALAIEPDHAMARYYLALASGQDGDPLGAIERLQALAADLPHDAPVRAELRRRIADLAREGRLDKPPELMAGRSVGPNPDQATMEAAANLPPADREAMIRGMVAGLAARLEREPNDVEGWLRLARSRAVLGENEAAADAYERAAELRPGDASLPLRAVEALLQGRVVTDPLPARVVSILRAVETKRPDEPAVLWYLGMAAAAERNRATAERYWRRLAALLPADHPDADLVRQALAALRGG